MSYARIVFQLECLSTPRNGEWCNMWHVHAVASVLKKQSFLCTLSHMSIPDPGAYLGGVLGVLEHPPQPQAQY